MMKLLIVGCALCAVVSGAPQPPPPPLDPNFGGGNWPPIPPPGPGGFGPPPPPGFWPPPQGGAEGYPPPPGQGGPPPPGGPPGFPPPKGGSQGRGPRPPVHNPDQNRPSEATGGNSGLTMNLGKLTDATDQLGSFIIWMFNTKCPDASGSFAKMATGDKPPEDGSGAMSEYSSFTNMGVDMVFPQFATCSPNVTAKVVGELGGARLTVINPGNILFIYGNEAEVAGMSRKDIGLIPKADYEFLESVRKYLCDDFCTYYSSDSSCTSTHRKKRSGDDYGFTSCSLK